MSFPLGTHLVNIFRGLQWIQAWSFDRNCQASVTHLLGVPVFTLLRGAIALGGAWTPEPDCHGANFSSTSIATLGNFLTSLCLSFLFQKG